MPIPFPTQPSITANEYPDTVTVYAASTSPDTQGTPDINTPGTSLYSGPACVKEVASGQRTRYEPSSLAGETQYEVGFPSDPSITSANQILVWSVSKGVSLTSPVRLATTGRGRGPHWMGRGWQASAIAVQ